LTRANKKERVKDMKSNRVRTNKGKLDGFVGFLTDMDNVQAERNELRLLVNPRYWRWSNRKLLRKIRKVGNAILRKGLPPEEPQEPVTAVPVTPANGQAPPPELPPPANGRTEKTEETPSEPGGGA
jgi:hypothetical protein